MVNKFSEGAHSYALEGSLISECDKGSNVMPFLEVPAAIDGSSCPGSCPESNINAEFDFELVEEDNEIEGDDGDLDIRVDVEPSLREVRLPGEIKENVVIEQEVMGSLVKP